jgi:hypothetical protein
MAGSRKPGLPFLILWCIIYAIGLFFSLGLLDSLPPDWETSPMVSGPVTGLCLGSLQWLLLRSRLGRAWLLIVASMVGWILGQLLWWKGIVWMTHAATGKHVHEFMRAYGLVGNWHDILQWTTIGLLIGVSQWFYLRSRRKRSSSWVSAVVIAHVISGCWIKSAGMFGLFVAPFAGAAAGAVSGGVLLWLPRGAEPEARGRPLDHH